MNPVALDRVKTYFARLVDGITRRVDWMAWYAAKVVSQNADGTLELAPDEPRVPGLSKVPIRLGVPGVSVKVAPGSRVLVGFENGDPRRPVASIWEKSTLLEVSLEPTTLLALGTSATQAAMHGTYFVAQLQALHGAASAAATAAAAAHTANAALAALLPTVTGPAALVATPPQIAAVAASVTAVGTTSAAATSAESALATAITAFNAAGSAPPGFLSTLVKVN